MSWEPVRGPRPTPPLGEFFLTRAGEMEVVLCGTWTQTHTHNDRRFTTAGTAWLHNSLSKFRFRSMELFNRQHNKQQNSTLTHLICGQGNYLWFIPLKFNPVTTSVTTPWSGIVKRSGESHVLQVNDSSHVCISPLTAQAQQLFLASWLNPCKAEAFRCNFNIISIVTLYIKVPVNYMNMNYDWLLVFQLVVCFHNWLKDMIAIVSPLVACPPLSARPSCPGPCLCPVHDPAPLCRRRALAVRGYRKWGLSSAWASRAWGIPR